MISFKNLALRRGTRVLFSGADSVLHAGERVGVVGANGAGKSSLFSLLKGELLPDEGDVFLPPQMTIAHVAQETPALECSALDYVLEGDADLVKLQAALVRAEADHAGNLIADIHAQLNEIDAYSAPARAARLLAGLGFSDAQMQCAVSTFSGGWRMRLNLAQALMCRSDLLLLDEPTNHLDLETVVWLSQFLKHYQGTLLLISHDRDFLDETVTHVLHLADNTLMRYTGNFSAFERQRAARLENQQAAFEKQQRERAHLQSFIDRFKAKATKARQAQSRMKALERMEEISAVQVESPFSFSFFSPKDSPNPLLALKKVSVGYGEKTILSNLSLSLESGARIGLLGVNGAGKSTLIQLLAGSLAPQLGEVTQAKTLKVGYFAQHQLEALRLDESPLQHLQRLDPTGREQEFRNYLGGFDFRGDKATDPVGPFSGGEQSRLALALLIWQRPNLLLLDEPTNHLDMTMRHALTVALQSFEGALVVVSHDRHLLRATTDGFWWVANGTVTPFEGDLDDYTQLRLGTQDAPLSQPLLSSSAGGDRKQQKREEAEARNRLSAQKKPLEKRLAVAEKGLARCSARRAEIALELGAESLYAPAQKARLQTLLQEDQVLAQEADEFEMEWLECTEALEQLNVTAS